MLKKMPLHLLGKKGWNVYNSDNVERVRRDKAEARAREEAQEQRMQEEDAARRLAILRGERPELIEAGAESTSEHQHQAVDRRSPQPRKRRRLRGEDETDAEIRHARQDVEAGEQARRTIAKPGKDHDDAPLLDHAGHLQLIPAPDEKAVRKSQKNAEAEAEKAKKRQREEDQYTMRFSNAAGFDSSVQQKPWYAAGQTSQAGDEGSTALVLAEVQGKDVWGNEDPLRKGREQSRISKNDPFTAMQQAQQQLKQSERDRAKWQSERAIEREELQRAEKRTRRKHRSRHEEQDSLDGFSLDATTNKDNRDGEPLHRHRRRHRCRSRSRSRERRRRSRD